MSVGVHTAAVRIHDRANHTVNYSWSFTVAPVVSDTVPPVTTALSAIPAYPGFGSVLFSATDAGSGVAHTYWKLDGGPQMEGPLLYSFAPGTHTVEYWSVDKAGNVEAHKTLSTFVSQSHAVPTLAADASCLVAGCHTSDNIAAIHGTAGCIDCHGGSVGATNDCSTCHGASNPPAHHDVHQVIGSSAAAGSAADCTKSACHGTSVVAIHPTCATCHTSTDSTVVGAIAAGNATCETCHGAGFFAATHGSTNASHVVSGSCFTSTCHGTDVTVMHTMDFRGSGETPPGCAACHGAGKTPSTNCTTCHADIITPHDSTRAHATVTTMLNTNSSACVACHGNDLTKVGSRLTSNGDVHVPLVSSDPVPEHKGCSCHAYHEAGQNEGLLPNGQVGCQNCHATAHYSAHGFGTGFTVSGHNTSYFGIVGARSNFSSFASMTTTASAPASFPLPPKNVFWAAGDPNAPAHAVTGLTWTSTVKCEDCHSALSSNEVAGPHGGAVFNDFGIDPNFSGSFDSAFLWGAMTAADTTSTNSSADTSIVIGANGYGVYNKNGGTPFRSKSGIVQYVPTMVNGETGEELADWDLASGAAHLETATVICVKCHDLYNENHATNTANYGWASYAHEHHAGRPVKFGTFAVSGASIATQTVFADTAADAIVQVSGATTSTTLVAPSLGRETAGACRDCHIAIPHGWKRPRLIVYSNLNGTADQAFRTTKGLPAGDAAPYNAGPSVYEGEGLAGTAIGSGQMNGLSSIVGPTVVTGDADLSNNWSSSQCNACGHHSGTDLRAGAWK